MDLEKRLDTGPQKRNIVSTFAQMPISYWIGAKMMFLAHDLRVETFLSKRETTVVEDVFMQNSGDFVNGVCLMNFAYSVQYPLRGVRNRVRERYGDRSLACRAANWYICHVDGAAAMFSSGVILLEETVGVSGLGTPDFNDVPAGLAGALLPLVLKYCLKGVGEGVYRLGTYCRNFHPPSSS